MSIVKKSLVALALVGGFATQADASDITFTTGGTGLSTVENFNEFGDNTTGGTVNLANIGAQLTFTGVDGSQIVTNSNPPIFQAPYGDTSNYLATYGGGTSTFTFTQPTTYFGFLWGSVDPYNTISFYSATNTLLGTFTGSQIIAAAGLTASSSGANGTTYANFSSLVGISKVVMQSSMNAFEIDNVSISNVPLPAALPLFGAAVMGLGAFRRKKAAA